MMLAATLAMRSSGRLLIGLACQRLKDARRLSIPGVTGPFLDADGAAPCGDCRECGLDAQNSCLPWGQNVGIHITAL